MAERVMSTLNLALQNVSLAREEMDPELEALIRHKTTLAQLREEIDRSPRLPVAPIGKNKLSKATVLWQHIIFQSLSSHPHSLFLFHC